MFHCFSSICKPSRFLLFNFRTVVASDGFGIRYILLRFDANTSRYLRSNVVFRYSSHSSYWWVRKISRIADSFSLAAIPVRVRVRIRISTAIIFKIENTYLVTYTYFRLIRFHLRLHYTSRYIYIGIYSLYLRTRSFFFVIRVERAS